MRAHERCVGVAAPQIDEPVRMVVVDVSEHPKARSRNGLLVLVTPRVVRGEGPGGAREGSLSTPELPATVRRATAVTVAALDPLGRPLEICADAFEARCLLH